MSEEADRRTVARSRLAGFALLVIFVLVGVFVLVDSQVTARSAHKAVAANLLSNDYDEAAAAVAAQESLEEAYQLGPSNGVRAVYYAKTSTFMAALGRVQREGDAGDRSTVTVVLNRYARFQSGVGQVFVALDDRDPTTARLLHESEIQPAYSGVTAVLGPAAEAADQEAIADLSHLERLESVTSWLTPLVFLLGLLLTVLMATLSGGFRRQLDAARARAVHDSLHDELTGLPNRRLFADRVEQAMRAAERSGAVLGVLIVDLDRFKEVNDTLGHLHGDELLVQVGQRLQAALRRSDTVARLGGDEFAVLLPELAQPADAADVAAKLTAQTTRTFSVHGVDLDLEASIGVVTYSPSAGVVADGDRDANLDTVTDAATLLQRADQAMYLAKARNLSYVLYDPAADTHASPATLTLLGELRRALERYELVLHFQPKVAVDDGRLVGVEALVRWQHPTRGLLYPDTFITVAEHTGLIGPLTRHVLELALRTARSWADAGEAVPIAVNLSARNLMDEHLPEQVGELLRTLQVPPELLHLEVTESAISGDAERAGRVLRELSGLGLSLSIDDFGAGYTSLAQLRDLPVDELKIDRSFVMTMLENLANAHIVSSVIELGHNLGLTIVAEGVESAEVLAALGAHKCDIAQGYFISVPLSATALAEWRRERAGVR